MSTFLEQIDSLQASLNGLRVETTRELLHLTDQARLATTSRQESQIDQQAQSLVQQSNQCLAKVKQTLERLQRETENGTLSDSECRMRKNLCASLTRSFVTTASAYKQAQEQYKLEVKNKLRRQVRNVQPHLTDDDIDHLLQQENGQRDAVYQQLVLQGSINHQVQSAVDQVADKYLVIQSLEASIAVLHQMFLDMSLLTHEQGLELDRIEIQVQQTNEHVEEGNVNVAKSIHYQTKIRKKRRWIVAIVLVIIIIAVVAPLLL